jgi:hypothetical protein
MRNGKDFELTGNYTQPAIAGLDPAKRKHAQASESICLDGGAEARP